MSRPKEWRRDVVEAVHFYQLFGGTFADAVLEMHGYPPRQAARMLEDAEREGLIACGVSVRTGWLTDKGRRLLHSDPAL